MNDDLFLSELLSTFLVGLLGGVHCASMCGGLVSALSLHGNAQPISIQGATRGRTRLHISEQHSALSSFIRLVCYNLGRIGSYTTAGLLVGGIGSLALLTHSLLPIQQILFMLANFTLIALGLYLSGLWHGVVALERFGYYVWQPLQPLTRRLLPIDSVGRALAAGALWGWIPCGMVYSVLAIALMSGSASRGALLLLAFGFGTLPNLLLLGGSVRFAKRWLRSTTLRIAAGVSITAFGLLGLLRLNPLAHLPSLGSWCQTLPL